MAKSSFRSRPSPELNFANLKFDGDPASPASSGELRKQAQALGAILVSQHDLAQFGCVRNGDPALEGDSVTLPRVHSIRSSRRIGPDGQVVFDLVAEVTQRRTVRHPDGSFDFFGGATVIIGPKGEIRFVIAKNLLNRARRERQREFMRAAGRRYWNVQDGSITPVRNAFALLHQSVSHDDDAQAPA